MPDYRGYYTHKGKRLSVEVLTAATQEGVVGAAMAVFHDRAGRSGEFEVWQAGRFVHWFGARKSLFADAQASR